MLSLRNAEESMRYLCLVYFAEEKLAPLTPSEDAELTRASIAYDDELRARGHLVLAQALAPVKAAATVRRSDGALSITDGPFAETREQLGGFLVVDARDLNEAIALASQIPVGRYGCVEVRPVKAMNASQ
jgi:hypothetical protein